MQPEHSVTELRERNADLERQLTALHRAETSGEKIQTATRADPGPDVTEAEFLQLQPRIIESMAAGISVTNEAGMILHTNPAADRMFGYAAGELIGKQSSVLGGYPDQENRQRVAEVAGLLQSGGAWTGEWLRRRKNGELFCTYARVTPTVANGNTYWICVEEDITERKRKERSLLENAERLSLALETSGMGEWSWDAETDRVTLSGAAARTFAITPGSHMRWREVQSLLHADDRDRARREVERAITERVECRIEYRLSGEGREGRWVLMTGRPIYDTDGRPTGLVGVVRDLTTEKEQMRREHEARVTAELLNSVGKKLATELDLEGLVQSATDLATRLVGAQFGAFFRKVSHDMDESYMLFAISGAPREAFSEFPKSRNDLFSRIFQGDGVVRSDDITNDPRYGNYPPYEGMQAHHLPVRSYLAAPVLSRSGEVLGGLFFGHREPGIFTAAHEEIVRGIAAQPAIAMENARLFDQLNRERSRVEETTAALRRANAALEQFAYSASHDLQEPLRMVSIYSQMLRRRFGDKLGEKGDEYINYAVEGATRMENLVRALLAYTRASSSTGASPGPVDANEILTRSLANLQVPITQAGAVVTSGPLPLVWIHEPHLEQLFQNLIGNGIKYRTDGDPKIEIAAERVADEWIFSIRDNGMGIDPRYKEYIFGIFKRLHSASEYSGTGIGLAICQRIIERAGGRIWVESQLGQGSTFFFSIPAADKRG